MIREANSEGTVTTSARAEHAPRKGLAAGSYRLVCQRAFHMIGKRTQPTAPTVIKHQAEAEVAGRQTSRVADGAGIANEVGQIDAVPPSTTRTPQSTVVVDGSSPASRMPRAKQEFVHSQTLPARSRRPCSLAPNWPTGRGSGSVSFLIAVSSS
jgi:hypothetical protein